MGSSPLSFFGFVTRALENERLRIECERAVLPYPERVNALTQMAAALMEAGNLEPKEAVQRALSAVQLSEVELLDTHEGRTVLGCDAMETLFAPPVVRTVAR